MSGPEEALATIPEPDTDAELVRASLDGDTGAFAALYGRHASAVRGRVRRALGGARADVDDAVQEAFLRAWCRLPQLRDAARFGAWVRAIAAAAAADRLRRRAREVVLPEPAPEAAAPRPAVDDAIALRHALAGLTRAQRAAIHLHYFRGLSPEEAGRRLGVPATTIRGRLQTGRAALRARLGGEGSPGAPPHAATPASLQALLAAIRRRTLDGAHALRGQAAVLFCGVPADVDLVPSPDGDLHVRGSVWAVGEQALAAIALRHDAVDDYLATGPHAGALFAGTRAEGGRPTAETLSVADWWAHTRGEMVSAGEAVAAAARTLAVLRRPCLRLSLVSPIAGAAWVGEKDEGAWRELGRHLAPNHTGEAGWHGPDSRAALTVEVPAGATLVVASFGGTGTAGGVAAAGLAADLVCLETGGVTVVRHRGDLTLWQARAERVSGLGGALRQYHAAFGPGSWGDGRAGRHAPEPSVIDGLEGEADIAVARDQLVLRAPAGAIRVENRFGDTVIEVGPHTRGTVSSLSGRIDLRLGAGAAAPALEARSPAGEVRWTGDLDADWDLKPWNTLEDLGLRPGGRDPVLRLCSEAGVVALARTAPGEPAPPV